MNLYDFDRLHLGLVEWVRLELHFVEVDGHEVNASDIAVPCCTIVEFKCILICRRCELCGTRQTLWNISHCVLASDRNVKVVQDVECLSDGLESAVPCW